LSARGWLTLAVERVEDWAGQSEDEPSGLPIRPAYWLPGVRLALIEQQTRAWFPLKTGLNAIGRFPENDIVLDERSVSRRHCIILVHVRGDCEIHDTASRNGTFVNGVRACKPVRLACGDQIRISSVKLVLCGARDEKSSADDALELDPDFPPTVVQE
jgi:pSer/pThr/pTyr-binding forkhead associated (FHA) protein